MLLAASEKSEEGEERVDVLFLDDVEPGTPVSPVGAPQPQEKPGQIDIDTFFSIPIRAERGVVAVGDSPLQAGGREVRTRFVENGSVG